MRTVITVILLALIATSAWLGVKNARTERELAVVRDTLYSLRIAQKPVADMEMSVMEKVGESYLMLNDSVVEIHRISGNDGFRHFLFRIEVNPDGRLRTALRKFSAKNPLTGEGLDSLFSVTHPKIEAAVFQEFKDKLAQIKLTEAAVEDKYVLCCFGGGYLTWEAVYPANMQFRFDTYCRRSEPFAEVCEFLLRHTGDPDFKNGSYYPNHY